MALRYIITINVPVVFMARYLMVLRGATSLRGALEGVGPEIKTFLGIWAQKSRDFQASQKGFGTCNLQAFHS
jgi:hypothetical protein